MPTAITQTLLRPDTGAVAPTAETPSTNLWDQTWALIHHPWTAYITVAVLATLFLRTQYRRRQRNKQVADNPGTHDGHHLTRTDRAVTRGTGALATGVLAVGMWDFFTDVVHLHPALRVVLFVFVEAQIVSAFRRGRRSINRTATLGWAPLIIYGLAAGSAGLAGWHAGNPQLAVFRWFVAGVAALMLVQELAEELEIYLFDNPDKRTEKKKRIWWAVSAEKILVWLHLAQATEWSVAEVERQRRIARFARTAYRLQVLKEEQARKWRVSWVRASLRRQTEAANEHLKLATDKALLGEVRSQLALLYGVEQDTSRAAVRDLRPLAPIYQTAISARPHGPLGDLVATRVGEDPVAMDIAKRSDTAVANEPAMEVATNAASVPATEVAEQPATAPANGDATPVANEPAAEVANPDATPAATEDAGEPATESATQVATNLARKPSTRRAKKAATDPANPDVPEPAIRLANFLAKYPEETHAQLAKRMRVGERSISRYRPAAEAYNAAREAAETEPVKPAIPATFDLPKPATTKAVNGHSRKEN